MNKIEQAREIAADVMRDCPHTMPSAEMILSGKADDYAHVVIATRALEASQAGKREHWGREQVKRHVIAAIVEHSKTKGMAVAAGNAADAILSLLTTPTRIEAAQPQEAVVLATLREIAAADPGPASNQSLAHEMAAMARQVLTTPTRIEAMVDEIVALRKGLVEAVIPLEALQLTHSTFNELSPEMRHQIGVSTAVIKALLKGTSDNGQG